VLESAALDDRLARHALRFAAVRQVVRQQELFQYLAPSRLIDRHLRQHARRRRCSQPRACTAIVIVT
jgi:hypothetical protein